MAATPNVVSWNAAPKRPPFFVRRDSMAYAKIAYRATLDMSIA